MDNYDITKVATEITEILTPEDLHKNQKDIVADLIKATSKDEFQKQVELFNLSQSKTNALRILKLQDAQSKVEDEIINRFDKRPDQMSNQDLLAYLTTISGQIEKSQKVVDAVEDKALARQMVATTSESSGNQYNINLGTDLNRENKDNVVDAIKDILSLLQNTTVDNPDINNLEEPEEVEIINEN